MRSSPEPMVRDLIFISYAREDKKWCERVSESLGDVIPAGIEIWNDYAIRAGSLWEREIYQVLGRTKAAVLVVSKSFLKSQFIKRTELPIILEAADRGNLALLWVAVEKGRYEKESFARYHALHDPSDPLNELSSDERKYALRRVSEKVAETVRGRRVLVAGSSRGDCDFDAFVSSCRSLGKQLAKRGFTIVCGSERPVTADRHVLDGANEVGTSVFRIGTPTGLRKSDKDWSKAWPNLRSQKLFRLSTWRDARPQQVSHADVVVLMGGGKGTSDVAYEAAWQRKPVVPAAALGGTAASWFEPLKRRLLRIGVPESEAAKLRENEFVEVVLSMIERWAGPHVRHPSNGGNSQREAGSGKIVIPGNESRDASMHAHQRKVP